MSTLFIDKAAQSLYERTCLIIISLPCHFSIYRLLLAEARAKTGKLFFNSLLLILIYLTIFLFLLINYLQLRRELKKASRCGMFIFIFADLNLPCHFSIFPFTAEARSIEDLRHGKTCCTENDICLGAYEVNIDVY